MREETSTRTIVVWTLLIAMTALSWVLGRTHGLNAGGQHTASVLVLVLAVVKARLVGLHFMALGNAPAALRSLFEIWCLLACATTVALFLVA